MLAYRRLKPDRSSWDVVLARTADGRIWKQERTWAVGKQTFSQPVATLHEGKIVGLFFNDDFAPCFRCLDPATGEAFSTVLRAEGLKKVDENIQPSFVVHKGAFFALVGRLEDFPQTLFLLSSTDAGKSWKRIDAGEWKHERPGAQTRPLLFQSRDRLHLMMNGKERLKALAHYWSDDAGKTWKASPARVQGLRTNTVPVAACAEGDRLAVLVASTEAFYSTLTLCVVTSNDAGATWNPAQELDEIQLWDLEHVRFIRQGERLAVGVVHIAVEEGSRTSSSVRVFHSEDGGMRWQDLLLDKKLRRSSHYVELAFGGGARGELGISCLNCPKINDLMELEDVSLLLLRWGEPRAEPRVTPEEERQIEGWIATLNDESIESRDRALRKIVAFGIRIRPHLVRTLKAEDLRVEVRARLQQAIQDLQPKWWND